MSTSSPLQPSTAGASPDAPPLQTSTASRGSLRGSRAVVGQVFGPPSERRFAVRYWDGTVDSPGNGDPQFTLVLTSPQSIRRMFLPPSELRLGEAFIRGDFDVEGSLEDATGLADQIRTRTLGHASLVDLGRLLLQLAANRSEALPSTRLAPDARAVPRHTRDRDAAAIRSHYDVGNDFYSLWLDKRMIYSCAYFETGAEDIHAAQEAKLEHICRKLRLKPGDRLLDVGCGWGGLIRYAAARFGVQALGITLSPSQAAYAQHAIRAERLGERCTVRVVDYRDLDESEPFDKIVSVGMFEHVGPARMNEYFSKVMRLLKPKGLFLNHGIVTSPADAARPHWRERITWRKGEFIDRYVFPDGDLVTLDHAARSAGAAGLEVRDVESLREHYALTLRRWGQRLDAAAARAVELVGEETYRVWRLYMAGSAYAFARGRISLAQILLAKPDGVGRVELPLTRSDLYRRPALPRLTSGAA